MKVGTDITNGGHRDADGCFRCRDDEQEARDVAGIMQACETGHREGKIAPATE